MKMKIYCLMNGLNTKLEGNAMIRVKVTFDSDWPVIKQTPGRNGVWGDCQFFINDDTFDCDYWFVFYGMNKAERVCCSSENIYFVSGEPNTVKTYRYNFLRQFSHFITCQKKAYDGQVIHSYMALPWMVGGHYEKGKFQETHDKDYDELKNMKNITKDKLISVISSDKCFTIGHQRRLEFVMKLKQIFGDKLDVFGRGINTFSDKWDVIAPYKYHIVIENDTCDDYFTEKLMDCYLGQAYPFYYGCTNIEKYYDQNSMTIIDIDDVGSAVRNIENAIKNNVYENRKEYIKQARIITLDKYNLFALMANEIKLNSAPKNKEVVWIYPEFECSFKGRVKRFFRFK